MTAEVPQTHLDLVSDSSTSLAILVTLMPDGSPHATPVWFDMDGSHFRFNTARGRVKDRNLQKHREVCLTIMDRDDDYHWLMVRGRVVGESEEGAEEHIADLSYKYRGVREYTIPEGQVRVMYTVEPVSIFAR